MKFFFVLFFTFICFENISFAYNKLCNVNSHCVPGTVCIDGTANNISDAGYNAQQVYTGKCVPMMPMRQICFLYNIMTGIFGKAIVALVVVSVGVSFMIGKIDYKHLITLMLGIVCIFGAYQIISLFMGNHSVSTVCEGIDYMQRIGSLLDNVVEDLNEKRAENIRPWMN